jgi:dihydrofolate reductase
MGGLVIDMSMSLDGYIAAPNDNPEQGLGEDGMRLHNWAFDDPSVFERVYGDLVEETGAVIMGRRSYDNSIEAWGGKGPLGDVPCFVVTHKPPASSDPVFTFVTDGIERALAKAQEVAAEKRIGLMGANIDASRVPRRPVALPARGAPSRRHGQRVKEEHTGAVVDRVRRPWYRCRGDHSLREYVEAVAAAVGAWLPGVVAQAAPAAT